MKRHTLLGSLLLALSLNAHAGRSCEAKPPSVSSVQRAMTLAEHTAAKLDASGAQVVMLARVGQNLSEYGLRYSHLAFAYREGSQWRVMHKLNQCGTPHAALYRQGLGEFFLDDLYDFEAGLVVLAPDVQARLLPLLRDNAQVARLNTSAYNMLAYPWALTYQQSNQWAIETLAMAQDPGATSRERAQAWLRLKDYQPTTLKISAMKRLGARVTAANIAFDDHPSAKRFTDRIETVTVDSVFAWLPRAGLGEAAQVIR
nr:DUF2145 domain-containing protein [uncultured Roseateles sp.]